MAKRNRKKSHWLGSLGKGLVFSVLRLAVVLVLVGILCFLAIYGSRALFYDLDEVGKMPQRSIVYDMDGKPYGYLHGENRILVNVDQVSEHFINALLAREDSRFYYHFGFDPIGVLRAIVRNIQSGELKEGASTITQQLARNSFDLGGKTLDRKLLELAVALRIEMAMSKDEILEAYMNRIYFGSGLYGIEAASRAYYDKPASALSLSEGALLSGLIRAPSRFSPFNNFDLAVRERDMVLDRMAATGFLKREEAEGVKRWPVNINKDYRRQGLDDYAMEAIVADLELILAEKDREEGGLRIYSTIDPRLQELAEGSIEAHLSEIESRSGFKHPPKSAHDGEGTPTRYVQGAAVVLDNDSGGIRAIVGGRDFKHSRFNRARLSERQIGSAMKPFVYAAGFGRGLLPGTYVSDGRIEPGEIRSSTDDWRPVNSDGKFGGLLPAAEGLVRSRNTMTVRVGEYAGLDAVRQLATNAGIAPKPPAFPAIYLGACETTLSYLTAAYSVFPNNGLRRQNYLIERIDDSQDRPVYRAAHISSTVMDPGSAWLTSRTLQEVVELGTGRRARSLGVDFPVGGKTGTTNGYVDAWFIGYSSTLTCGVWVGMDNAKTIMYRGYGSTLALPIWSKIMAEAPKNRYPAEELKPEVAMTSVRLCRVSGALATPACNNAGSAYMTSLPVGMVPQRSCQYHSGRQQQDRPERKPFRPSDIIDSIKGFFSR